MSRAELIELVRGIQGLTGSTDEIDAWVYEFIQHVPHPGASDLIFWSERELSPEQIVDEALAWKPDQTK